MKQLTNKIGDLLKLKIKNVSCYKLNEGEHYILLAERLRKLIFNKEFITYPPKKTPIKEYD